LILVLGSEAKGGVFSQNWWSVGKNDVKEHRKREERLGKKEGRAATRLSASGGRFTV